MVVNTVSPGAKKQPVIVVHDLTASVTDTGGQTDVIPVHFSKAFDKVSGFSSSQNTLYIMFVHFVCLCMAYM